MDKIKRLENAFNFCSVLRNKAIKAEVDNVLEGFCLKDIKLQNGTFECEFSNESDEKISLSISPREIRLYRYNADTLISMVAGEEQVLRQITIQKRELGILYKEMQKRFMTSKRFKDDEVLVDLVEDSYVFSKDKINSIISKGDFSEHRLMYLLLAIKKFSASRSLEDICDLHSRFSTHMNYYVSWEGGRKITDNIYPTRTYLNNEDVSNVFALSDGPDKLYRVYDLYNGVITPQNEKDINLISIGLLSADAFDFRSLKGITQQEDSILGKFNKAISDAYTDYLARLFNDAFGYKGEITASREDLLEIITYQMQNFSLANNEPSILENENIEPGESGPKRLLGKLFKKKKSN